MVKSERTCIHEQDEKRGFGKEYAAKKADYIASIFLEAVKRWEMMEGWK